MSVIDEFVEEKIDIIKAVAREHAIHNASADNGFNVNISKEDIKKATGKQRLREASINKIVKKFENAGMEVEKRGSSLNVFCPPLLADKGTYTLDEIEERKKMIDDLNTIQAYKLMNE